MNIRLLLLLTLCGLALAAPESPERNPFALPSPSQTSPTLIGLVKAQKTYAILQFAEHQHIILQPNRERLGWTLKQVKGERVLLQRNGELLWLALPSLAQ